MTTITPEQRREVEQAGDAPVRLTDPETNDAYYLLREEMFERLRGIFDEPDMREVGRLVTETMREEDAGDPLLDSYQKYRA